MKRNECEGMCSRSSSQGNQRASLGSILDAWSLECQAVNTSTRVQILAAVGAFALLLAGSSAGSKAAGAKAIAISAGGEHTCAVTSAGGAKCWGWNYGELGDGTETNRHTPVGVSGLSSGVAAISAGGFHTCALTSTGQAKCWGDNMYGELGDGTQQDRRTPVGVFGLARGVTAVAAGDAHTCVLTSAGGVMCWGDNEDGQLGHGQLTDYQPYPGFVSGLASGVTAIATGGLHTCALTSAGGVKCWGLGGDGELGDGTRNDRRTPVGVSGLTSGVSAIAAGGGDTCALTSTGGLKCWGSNDHGQLGGGSRADRLTPVGVSGLASGVTAIAVGNDVICALTSGGAVKCWGYNLDGELGDGTRTERHTPAGVSGLSSGVTAISAGDGHTCALTRAGAIMCWGLNEGGELGDGTTIRSHTPIGVAGFGGSIKCGVPRLVGKPLAKARTTIVRAHCRLGRVTRVTSKKRNGTVVGQSPRPGTRLKKGSKVRLVISRGR